MADVEFEDNSLKIKEALFDAGEAFIHEACGELQAETRRNSRVDTGQTKGSYEYKIKGSFMAGEQARLEVISKTLSGKNLEPVNMHYMETGEKGDGFTRHRKGSFIAQREKPRIGQCIMPL